MYRVIFSTLSCNLFCPLYLNLHLQFNKLIIHTSWKHFCDILWDKFAHIPSDVEGYKNFLLLMRRMFLTDVIAARKNSDL